jgi:putative exosortase-associated protein (TIGR04073 family)
LLSALALVPHAALAAAGSTDPDQGANAPTGTEKRLKKLGRGLANTGLGWVEMGVVFYENHKERKPITYQLCVGPMVGLKRTLLRTFVGVYEVVTFPVSWGAPDFGPLVEPEFIP